MNSKPNAIMSLAWEGASQDLTDTIERVRACLAALDQPVYAVAEKEGLRFSNSGMPVSPNGKTANLAGWLPPLPLEALGDPSLPQHLRLPRGLLCRRYGECHCLGGDGHRAGQGRTVRLFRQRRVIPAAPGAGGGYHPGGSARWTLYVQPAAQSLRSRRWSRAPWTCSWRKKCAPWKRRRICS